MATAFPRWRVLVLVLALLFGALPAVAQEERIHKFDSLVQVGADGGLTVTETIAVTATGAEIRRGIYRDFPTVYRALDGSDHIVEFDVVEVRRNGEPISYFTEGRINGVRVYMGAKDKYIDPGRYTYTLTYRTDRQIGFFETNDELYWNVTGNDWVFPIDSATVTIVLPDGATVLSRDGYTGQAGEQGRDWTAAKDSTGPARFATTRSLAPGEGFTVAVTWPKGFVAPPTESDEFWWTLRGYTGYLAAIVIWLVILTYYLIVWRKVGRDPEAGTIVPRWQPPKGLSPAASRFVAKMGFDGKALGAAVVNLAVKGRLVIEDDGNDTYTLRRRDGTGGAALAPGEAAMEAALFRSGDAVAVRKGNHAQLKPAVDALRKTLTSEYEGAQFRRNSGWFALGTVASFLSLTVLGPAIASTPGPKGPAPIFFAIAGLIAINWLFFKLLRAPTATGRRMLDEIEGFKMYLVTAEQERLNLLNPPERTPELFERYLPYAIALDVENEWGEQFSGILAAASAGAEGGYRPRWYSGKRGFDAWSTPGAFAGSLGSSFSRSISAAATPPGSRSGSGGRGSSGGGGGGGGGGGF